MADTTDVALRLCPFCGDSADPDGWLDGDDRPGPRCHACHAHAASAEAWNKRVAPPWHPITTASRDGTVVLVYAPERIADVPEPLSAIVCTCAWHPDAGWHVDELRRPTHWMPLPASPEPAP